jgi:tRNA-2-methylthio-N6-dimethylallyladenosine synthase
MNTESHPARAPKVYLETYGCQMNVADSELVTAVLRRAGYASADRPDEADVILLNTCAIREHAEERVLGRLSYLYRYKSARPEVRLGLRSRRHGTSISSPAPMPIGGCPR